ncbi:P-II family nitrogen regulator, partial [bacterium]
IPDLPAVAISDCRVAAAHDDPFGEVRKTRIELVVEDDGVETVVRTIARAARTGQPGDGRIFVLDVERSVLIRDTSRPSESPGEGMG